MLAHGADYGAGGHSRLLLPLLLLLSCCPLALLADATNTNTSTSFYGHAAVTSPPGFLPANTAGGSTSAEPDRAELQLVPFTYSAVAEPLDGTLSANGAAEGTADMQVTHLVGSTGAQSRVRLRLGGETAGPATTATFTPALKPAATLSATLLTTAVYPDQRTVHVLLQWRDANGLTRATGPNPVARLIPSAALRTLANVEPTASCTPGSTSGACVAAVVVPTAWVVERGDLQANGPLRNASAMLRAGLSLAALADVDTVTIRGQPVLDLNLAAPLPAGAILATLPTRPLASGDTFDVPVVGLAENALETFRVRVLVAPELELLAFVVDTALWTGDAAITGGRSGTASFILVDSAAAPGGSQAGVLQRLLTLRVRVRGGAAVGLNHGTLSANVTLHALFLSDVTNRELVNGQDGAFLWTAGGLQEGGPDAPGTTDLLLHDAQRPVGVVSHAATAELINTAALNGARVATPITTLVSRAGNPGALQVTVDGAGGLVGLTCVSSSREALKVEAACSEAFLTGTELDGSDVVTVSVTLHYGSPPDATSATVLSATVRFRVWLPDLPVTVQLSQTTVRRVANWLQASVPSAAECDSALQFQQAAVRVVTRFNTRVPFVGGVFGPYVDVTEHVAARLHVVAGSDGGRAVLLPTRGEGGRPVVQGLVSGSVTVRYVKPGTELDSADALALGQATLAVDGVSAPVAVQSIEAALVSRVSLAHTGGSVSRDGLATLTATVARDTLAFEGAVARVVAAARFADGTRMALPLADPTAAASVGLQLTSLHAGTIAVGDAASSGMPDAVAVRTGATGADGSLAVLTWAAGATDGVCGRREVGTGAVVGRVLLPAAREAKIALAVARLAPPGDAAAAAGVPTAASLTVSLLYPDGRTVDATRDNRTQYNASAGFAVVIDTNGARLEALSGATAGVGTLRVSFAHENVTAIASAAIVTAVDLVVVAQPLPAYTGSAEVRVANLRPIAGTAPQAYQEAVLAAHVHLTDGTSRSVASSSALAATVTSGGLGTIRSAPGNTWRIVVAIPAAGSTPEPANVTLTFTGFETPRVLTLAVDSTPVRVTALTGLVLDAGSGLRGMAGATTSQLRLGAVFDDGTRYPSLLTGATDLTLPGIVIFASAVTDAVTVGVEDGRATLRGNAASTVTLTATVPASAAASAEAIVASLGIACNLDPAAGDVDLGAAAGVPLPAVAIGASFTVGVFVNTAGRDVGAYEFQVQYDSTALEVTDASADHGGLFDRRVDSAAGTVTFGGTIAAGEGRGSRLRLATLTLRSRTAGRHVLNGTVVTLGEDDVAGTPIGGATPRTFVAGAVAIDVTATRRRRAEALPLQPVRPSKLTLFGVARPSVATAKLSSPPAARHRHRRATCATGDTNGDCGFSVTDVAVVSTYLVQAAEGFVSATGQKLLALHATQPHTEAALDADHNSVVNERDAAFLNKVNFQLLRFVEGAEMDTIARDSDCTFGLRFQLLQRGDVPAPADATRMYAVLQNGGVPGTDTAQEAVADIASHVINGRHVGPARIVPDDGSVAADVGAVLEVLSVSSGSDGLWEVRLPLFQSLSDVGVSLFQLVPGALEPSVADYQLFSGAEGVYRFPGQLRLALADASGGTAIVQSNSPVGYNPLFTIETLNDTVAACRTRQGLCLTTGDCVADEYLNGTCTFETSPRCLPCAVCDLNKEREDAPCNATSNTICAPLDTMPGTIATTSTSGAVSPITTTSTVPPTAGVNVTETTTIAVVTTVDNATLSTVGNVTNVTMLSTPGNATTLSPNATTPLGNLTVTTVGAVPAGSSSDDDTALVAAGAAGGLIFLLLLLLLLILLVRRRRRAGKVDPEGPKVVGLAEATGTPVLPLHQAFYGFDSLDVPRTMAARDSPSDVFTDRGALHPVTLVPVVPVDPAPVADEYPAVAALREPRVRESAIELVPESISAAYSADSPLSLSPVEVGLAVRYHAALGHDTIVRDVVRSWPQSHTGYDQSAELPPLHVAALYSQASCVAVLLDEGASTEARASNSRVTALHMACVAGSLPCVRLLHDSHAILTSADYYGFEPLHVAAATSAEIVCFLLDAGCHPNGVHAQAVTPLMVAAAANNIDAVRALLDAGADVDALDDDGRSALHHGCAHVADAALVALLLEKGAVRDRVDAAGQRPVDFARASANSAALAALESAGSSGESTLLEETTDTQSVPLSVADGSLGEGRITVTHGVSQPMGGVSDEFPASLPYVHPPAFHEDDSEDEEEDEEPPRGFGNESQSEDLETSAFVAPPTSSVRTDSTASETSTASGVPMATRLTTLNEDNEDLLDLDNVQDMDDSTVEAEDTFLTRPSVLTESLRAGLRLSHINVDDEWFCVQNVSDEHLVLDGCYLQDNTGATSRPFEDAALAPMAYATFWTNAPHDSSQKLSSKGAIDLLWCDITSGQPRTAPLLHNDNVTVSLLDAENEPIFTLPMDELNEQRTNAPAVVVASPQLQYDNTDYHNTTSGDAAAEVDAEADVALSLLAALNTPQTAAPAEPTTPAQASETATASSKPSLLTLAIAKAPGADLGLSVGGGTETGLGGIFVSHVATDGAAYNQVYPNDEIMALGTKRMRTLTNAQARALLEEARPFPEVHMVVLRPHATTARLECRGLQTAGAGRFVLDKPLRQRRSIGLASSIDETLNANPFGATLPENAL